MLQIIYTAVGVLVLVTGSIFLLCNLYSYACDLTDRIRNPIINYYTIKTFHELALAFHQDKKLEHIFKTLADNHVWGKRLDVWKFRDDVEAKFEINAPQGKP